MNYSTLRKSKTLGARLPDAEQLFNTLDFEGSGALYYQEFAGLSLCISVYAMDVLTDFMRWLKKHYGEDPGEIMEALDENNSDNISLKEFCEKVEEVEDCPYNESEIELAFRCIDLSGSKMISKNELQAMMEFNASKLLKDLRAFCAFCQENFGNERKAFRVLASRGTQMSMSEFDKACTKHGFTPTYYTTRHIFSFMDVDNSGQVREPEFFWLEGFAFHSSRVQTPGIVDFLEDKFGGDLNKAWDAV